jgi:hypothetical protein
MSAADSLFFLCDLCASARKIGSRRGAERAEVGVI